MDDVASCVGIGNELGEVVRNERQRTVSPLNLLGFSARMRLSAGSRQHKGMAIRDNKEGYVGSTTDGAVVVGRTDSQAIWQALKSAIRGVP